MKRLLQRWDPCKKTYKPYLIPGQWNISTYEHDMAAVVNCAACGQRLSFGDSYTSRQIHTPAGMGFAVCSKCHEREWKEERNDPVS